MNIFKLDADPILAAKYHHLKHVQKQILESAQLLCTAVRLNIPDLNDSRIYKAAYQKHPCTIACTRSREVFKYTATLGLELNKERMWRYSKPTHKSAYAIEAALEYIDHIPDQKVEWPLAMPDEYKTDCPVKSYRNYYIGAKTRMKNGKWMMYYSPRAIPSWIPSNLQSEISLHEECEDFVKST